MIFLTLQYDYESNVMYIQYIAHKSSERFNFKIL